MSVWGKAAILSLTLQALLGCRASDKPVATCTPDAAVALYERRIEPILKDDHPKSCNQCHLSGIDLSLFVRDTPCQTMACLRELNLVDFEHPEQSQVLGWIERAKPESELITAQVIQQEHAAFLEWIRYSASCSDSVCPTYADACGQTQADASVRCELPSAEFAPAAVDPSDCSELTLERLFTADIYAWRERCFPCHFTSDTLVSAPKWISDVDRANQHPELACTAGALATMRTVLARGYVNLTLPSQSLLLLKPLSTPGGGITHGGGQKFNSPSDPSYQTFLAWIKRYADCIPQNPALSMAGPPPELSSSDDAGMTAPIYDYCNCILRNCHDQAHAKWGVSDEAVLAGCRSEAIALPSNRAPIMMGNFFECRAAYCAEAGVLPSACSAALGESVCL